VTGTAEVADDLAQPLGEGAQLQLLAFDNDEAPTLASLQQEEPAADVAAHADHHLVGGVEDVVHDGESSFKDAVLLTLKTTGVESVKATALTEHVEMTVR
jgi:hypothetical protein